MTDKSEEIEEYMAPHYVGRSNWLRAAVLGANDGILSTASLAIGVAAATETREGLVLATLAGVVAGALSMAAGEYVSVSSQTDTEQADIERERKELEEMPEQELQMLTDIYIERGLSEATAKKVAVELTEKDALKAHVRDELGLNEVNEAKPIQAALTSGIAFTIGGALPLLVSYFFPLDKIELALYISAIFFLIVLGMVSARIGGSPIWKAILRITFWGTVAMGITALIGYLFGVNV